MDSDSVCLLRGCLKSSLHGLICILGKGLLFFSQREILALLSGNIILCDECSDGVFLALVNGWRINTIDFFLTKTKNCAYFK